MNRSLALLSFLGLLVAGCAKEPLVGAYSPASVNDPQVQAAAKFAVEAQAKKMESGSASPQLVKVLRAESQVVAGTNYQLVLKVKVKGQLQTAETVVWWQPWRTPEPYQLTSWNWK